MSERGSKRGSEKYFQWRVWQQGYSILRFVKGPDRLVAANMVEARHLVTGSPRPAAEAAGEWTAYWPSTRMRLHRKFAKVGNRVALLNFVKCYGLLHAEEVDDPAKCLEQAEMMRHVLAIWDFINVSSDGHIERQVQATQSESEVGGQESKVTRYELVLPRSKERVPLWEGRSNPRGQALQRSVDIVNEQLQWNCSSKLQVEGLELVLVHKPVNLLGYLWLELSHELSGIKEWKRCASCRELYPLYSANAYGEGRMRRGDSLYCSPACKQRAKRSRRTNRDNEGAPGHSA